MKLVRFVAHSWPPGRACGEGGKTEFYKDSRGDFSQEVQDLLDGLSILDKRTVQSIIVRVIRDAEAGHLTPVTGSGRNREGQVEQLSITDNKILEIRFEQLADWDERVFPGKCLRLYFAEPAFEETIEFLHIAPKHNGKVGKHEQNKHAKEALYRAERLD